MRLPASSTPICSHLIRPSKLVPTLSSLLLLVAAGVEVRALSFDSLREVTECLLEMNQEVVKVILDCKKDVWKSRELFELVEEYFENSLKTLDFCSALEKCLKRARDSQLMIHVGLQRFEEEGYQVEEKETCAKILGDLRVFRDIGDPFTEEFFETLTPCIDSRCLCYKGCRHELSFNTKF